MAETLHTFIAGSLVVGNYSESWLRLTERENRDGESGWACEYVTSGEPDWVSDYQLQFFRDAAGEDFDARR